MYMYSISLHSLNTVQNRNEQLIAIVYISVVLLEFDLIYIRVGAEIREEKRVLECLKKSTKIAAQCSLETAQRILLYTDLLSRYTFFHVRGNTAVCLTL